MGTHANTREAVDATTDPFRALADPTRRGILRLLRDGEMNAGEIAARFPLGKPAMSHHLATLRAAGFLDSRKEAQTIWYALNPDGLKAIAAWVEATLGARSRRSVR
jgi:DNA-binding transcriptional ArsR family regulator